ncbi:hypothetical protein GYH30_014848 [Glycine max]|uniref:Uncharacterized protein n=1 Tax=Glycine max TaxID=3847 RepID=A0A0R0JFT6_SOYBN|nr:hypothetical protein GYH30_014848 [Glycine max]
MFRITTGSPLKILLFLANHIFQQVACQKRCFILRALKLLAIETICVYSCLIFCGQTKSIPSHLKIYFQMLSAVGQCRNR